MFLDRRTLRILFSSGAFLGLLAIGWVLATGVLKTILFVTLAASGIAVGAAVWPEILVMAYLFAGRYGFEARLAPGDMPLSLNQMILVGLVVLGLLNVRYLIKALRTWSSLGLILFGLTLLLGLGYTLGLNYGLYKITRTWLVVVPGVLIAGALIERRGSLLPLVAASFLVGLALNSAALLNFDDSLSSNSRLSALGSGPNVFARTVGLSLLISMFTVMWLLQKGVRANRDRVALGLAGVAVLWLLPGFVFAQSRGPALALGAALAMVVVFSLYGNWRTVVAGLFALVFTIWAGSSLVNTVLGKTRFDITQKSNQGSLDARVTHLWDTWDLIVTHPLLGVGTGGWPVHVFGIDERRYPHNFFAEIAVENGLALAGLLAIVFAFVITRAVRVWANAREPQSRFLLMGSMATFGFFMINVSVTGDSIDNRLIWLALVAVEFSTKVAQRASQPVQRVRLASVGPAPSS